MPGFFTFESNLHIQSLNDLFINVMSFIWHLFDKDNRNLFDEMDNRRRLSNNLAY